MDDTITCPDAEATAGPRDPGPSPVHPLGSYNGRFYFFDHCGQLRKLSASSLRHHSVLISLFLGNAEWLRNRFPRFDGKFNWRKGFNTRECNSWLVDQCSRRGLFDPERLPARRGHGVWPASDTIAAHAGDRVIFMSRDSVAPEEYAAGLIVRGALWLQQPARTPPAPASAAATAQQVERMFGMWHWRNLGEERIFTGLWAAGLLGAAIRWRAHGLLVGPAGSGKSTLLELHCALSPLATLATDYTAPGVRQLLTGHAAPLVLDVADEDPEAMDRLQAVLSMLRGAPSGDGARVILGSGDGKPMACAFMSPAILCGEVAPSLMPRDGAHITKMELMRIPDGAPVLPIEAMMAWAKQQAAGLWGRALDGIPRFRVNLATVRAALLGRGCSPRLADQLATILAARAMMLDDEPLNATGAEEDARAVSWLLQARLTRG
jgi:hypothetical protein